MRVYLLFVPIMMLSASADAQDAASPWRVEIAFGGECATVEGGISIEVTAWNISNRAIRDVASSGGAHGESIFYVDVRNAKGAEPALTRFGRAARGQEVKEEGVDDFTDPQPNIVVDVPPGGNVKSNICVSDLFSLEKGQKYYISVSRILPSDRREAATSNTIELNYNTPTR